MDGTQGVTGRAGMGATKRRDGPAGMGVTAATTAEDGIGGRVDALVRGTAKCRRNSNFLRYQRKCNYAGCTD